MITGLSGRLLVLPSYPVYLDFNTLLTGGTSLKRILYRQLGHFDSVYPLISTRTPHLAHLYKLCSSYNPLDVPGCGFTHWCSWNVCSTSKYSVTFTALPYASGNSLYTGPVTLRAGMVLFHVFFDLLYGSLCFPTVSGAESSGYPTFFVLAMFITLNILI